MIFRPRVFRWGAIVVLPLAAIILFVLSHGLVVTSSNGRTHPVSMTVIRPAEIIVIVLALAVSSPLLVWVVKKLVILVVVVTAVGWLAFSVAITGGHEHWWGRIGNLDNRIALVDVALLTCVLGGPIFLLFAGGFVTGVLRRRSTPLSQERPQKMPTPNGPPFRGMTFRDCPEELWVRDRIHYPLNPKKTRASMHRRTKKWLQSNAKFLTFKNDGLDAHAWVIPKNCAAFVKEAEQNPAFDVDQYLAQLRIIRPFSREEAVTTQTLPMPILGPPGVRGPLAGDYPPKAEWEFVRNPSQDAGPGEGEWLPKREP